MRRVVKHISMKLIFQVIKFLRTALITDADVAANPHDKRDLSVFEKLDDIFPTGETAVKDEDRWLSIRRLRSDRKSIKFQAEALNNLVMTFILPRLYLLIFIDKPKHRDRPVAKGHRCNDSFPTVNEISLINKQEEIAIGFDAQKMPDTETKPCFL